MKHILFLFFSLLFSISVVGQEWRWKNFGIQIGVSADLGTHVRQIGLKIQGYYLHDYFQINAGNSIRFHDLGWGNRMNYITQRINTGVVILAGKSTIRPQFILDGLFHQSTSEFGLAYNYLLYFDNAGTTQKSGGFGLHIKQFSFLIENDIFAGLGRDRFRTNDVAIIYHDDLYSITLNSLLWTGDTRETQLIKTTEHGYPIGYKDLSKNLYGKTSHGTLTLGIDYQIFYGNYVGTTVGIDSERIRHSLQNKLMHNKVFLPKKWRKENANYPMLNKDGMPVHSKKEAKSAQFIFQAGLNRGWSY